MIRVRTLCFESGPYCPIILHDVLSFHLVILFLLEYVFLFFVLFIIVSYHAFYMLLS